MNDRLQFRHHSEVFATNEAAIDYIIHNTTSLYAEPLVVGYGDPLNPNVILVIGAATNETSSMSQKYNSYTIIDIAKTEQEIADLEEEIEAVAKSLTILTRETDTLKLYSEKTEDGTVLSGDVKVAEYEIFDNYKRNNIIHSTPWGIFTYVGLDFDPETDTFTFTVNGESTEFQVENNYVVSGKYKRSDESIHLTMKNGDEVVIDVSKLIGEWTVEGENSPTPIVLTKETVKFNDDERDQEWKDVLKGDIRISPEEYNILAKSADGRSLVVKGVAKNITYWHDGEKLTVKEGLDRALSKTVSTDSANMIYERVDGIFAHSDLEYISSENKLVFTVTNATGGTTSKELELVGVDLFTNIYYDSAHEELVLQYKDNKGEIREVRIPISDMISEWEPYNEGHSLELVRQREVTGKDKLYGDVKISSAENNILTEVDHRLYVNGVADNIKYNPTKTVRDKFNELDAKDAEIEGNVEGLGERVAELENTVIVDVMDADGSVIVNKDNPHKPALSVNVSAAENNIITKSAEGIFANATLAYDEETNKLTFTNTLGSQEFQLVSNNQIRAIYYDSSTEEIVIVYVVDKEEKEVRVPLRGLIDEWTVDNDGHTVLLTKVEATGGAPDKLSADLRISERADNLIQILDGKVYASKAQIDQNAADIVILKGKVEVNEAAIAALQSGVSALEEKTDATNARLDEVSAKADANEAAIAAEVARATGAEGAIGTRIDNLTRDLSDEVNRATAAETANANAIAGVETRTTALEVKAQELTDAITAETTRAISAETALNTRVDETNHLLEDESARAQAAEQANALAINAVAERATALEAKDVVLENAIAAEVTRATSAETALDTKIAVTNSALEAETARATAAEQANTNATNAVAERATALEARATALETGLTAANTAITENANAIIREQGRAQDAELVLSNNIADLGARMTTAEGNVDQLRTDLTAETTRATSAETSLQVAVDAIISDLSEVSAVANATKDNLESEITRAQASETAINNALQNEYTRATGAEAQLSSSIEQVKADTASTQNQLNLEITRSTEADTQFRTDLTAEKNRALSAETALDTKITEEGVRAATEEIRILHLLDDEAAARTNAVAALNASIENEVTRATNKENEIQSILTAEITRSTEKDAELTTAINNEVARATAKEAELEGKIGAISGDTEGKLESISSSNVGIGVDNTDANNPVVTLNLSATEGNIVKLNGDGIFASADIFYNEATNTLTFSNSNGSKDIALVSNSLVDRIYYQPADETIVVEYTVNGVRMPDVVIDVTALVTEWEVGDTSTVDLTRTRNVSGIDQLTANVKVATNIESNILKIGDGLYVDGTQIETNKSDIAAIKTATAATSDALAAEVTRAQGAEQANASAIAAEVERSTRVDGEHDAAITSLGNQVSTVSDNLAAEAARAAAAEQANSNAISAEATRALSAETALQTALNAEVTRATAKENEIEGRVANLETASETTANGLAAEITRATNAENALTTSIHTESDRAISAETELQTALSTEKTRAENAEAGLNTRLTAAEAAVDANATEIANEVARSTQADNNLQAAITAEETRATLVENDLTGKVEGLTTRTTAVEGVASTNAANIATLQTDLSNEIIRSTGKDAELESAVNSLTGRVSNVETSAQTNATAISTLDGKLTNEITRSTAKDEEIEGNVSAIATRLSAAEAGVQTNATAIATENSRATLAEQTIQANVDAVAATLANVSTAVTKNAQDIVAANNAITAETAARQNADSALAESVQGVRDDLAAEYQRAYAKEIEIANNVTTVTSDVEGLKPVVNANSSAITAIQIALNDEINRSTTQDTIISGNLESEISRSTAKDAELEAKIEAATLTFNDTTTIDLVKDANNNVTGKLKISNADTNIITSDSANEGIFASVRLDYDTATNKLKLVTSAGEQAEIQLNGGSLIESMEYDSVNKELVITYKDQSNVEHTVRFGVTELFNDWIVENPSQRSAVELTKTEGTGGNPSILSAKLLLSPISSNIAEFDTNGLYVDGSQIEANKESIETLEAEVAVLEAASSEYIQDLSVISATVASYSSRIESLESQTAGMQNRMTQIEGQFETINNTLTANTKAIADESARAIAAENALRDAITAETAAREAADSALSDDIAAEAAARQDADNALQEQITQNKLKVAEGNTSITLVEDPSGNGTTIALGEMNAGYFDF